MGAICDVKLELLRSGPAHNQLLSPLTPYIALCGSAGPVTVNAPFEHRQLLARLERLRYAVDDTPIAASQRESELRDLGESVGRFLGQVPTLMCELSNASQNQPRLVNLRLSVSAYELGLVPFETVIGPDGFPASGAPLVLRSLVSLTREVRRSQPLALHWNRPPRILFAYAAPDGSYVPWKDHVMALGRALRPWTNLGDDGQPSAKDMRQLLKVLPDASVESIREACRSGEYTHVHLLAHGAPFKEAGVERYGLRLCTGARDKTGLTVDGESLAIALTGSDSSGHLRQAPTLVSLAVCDSGNTQNLLVPGGSIAHELHMQGIPWVIASQFPLWMSASTLAAELLYSGLLNGDDPRWVLYELRQRLRTDVPGKHDWASIVAYATITSDLEAQVAAFRDKQFRARTEVLFARMDAIAAHCSPAGGSSADAGPGADTAPGPDSGTDPGQDSGTGSPALSGQHSQELDQHSHAIRGLLADWRAEPACLHDAQQRAERLGLSGASEKRIAIAYALLGDADKSRAAYRCSREFYRQALQADPVSHWLLTQYLSLTAIQGGTKSLSETELAQLRSWWSAARQIACWRTQGASGLELAWALATQAELELLGAVYDKDAFQSDQARKRLEQLGQQLREAQDPQSFAMQSTLRQFGRYASQWPDAAWDGLAQALIGALRA